MMSDLTNYIRRQEQRGQMRLYVYCESLADNHRWGYRPQERIYAASTLKAGILLALLELYDAGRIKLSDKIVLRRDYTKVFNSSGVLRLLPPPITLSVYHCAILMMAISDNVASDALIELMEGIADATRARRFRRLNKLFKDLGAGRTVLEASFCNPLVRDKNFTTVADLGVIMKHLYSGDRLKVRTRQILRRILTATRNNTSRLGELYAAGLDLFHKSGSNPHIILDAGVILAPDRPLILSIAVAPRNRRVWRDGKEKAAAEKTVVAIAKKISSRFTLLRRLPKSEGRGCAPPGWPTI